MKKKFLCMITVLILAVVGVGCADKAADISETLLLSFETRDELRDVGITQRFGKLELNTDAHYVREGSASLAVYVYGDFENNVTPQLTISAKQDTFPTMNFSKFSYISIDVFNSGEKDVPMRVWLTALDSDIAVVTTPATDYVLKAGAWNKVVYDFGGGSMAVGYPLTNTTGIKFEFPEYRTDHSPYSPSPLYFDNLVAIDKGETYNPTRASGELLYFENLGDVNVLTRSSKVSLSNNGNPLFVSQGSLSVKAVKSGVGNGTVTVKRTALGDRLNGVAGVSIDIYNGDKNVGEFLLQAVFINSETLAEIPVNASAIIFSGSWTTLSLNATQVPEGYKLSDVAYFRIVIPVETAYIDNFKSIA